MNPAPQGGDRPPLVEADGVEAIVGFAVCLRGEGAQVPSDVVQAAVAAVATLGVRRLPDVYWALRLTLCRRVDDLPLFDRVFVAYFAGRGEAEWAGATVESPPQTRTLGADTGEASGDDGEAGPVAGVWSAVERLQDRDIGTLDEAERAVLNDLLAALSVPGEPRRSRRRRPASHGAVDPRRTVRAWTRSAGEPARLHYRTARTRERPVVLLLDVSGSMAAYSTAFLRLGYAAARRSGRPAEVFALGTRLTRLTPYLTARNPDAAVRAAAAAMPDSGGGTRLGLLLKEFLDRWGRRSLARGAVVVIVSDGWERAEPELLGEQVARLSRLAHRVVWANPRKAAPGYAPLAGGMAACLPYVDDFVEGHSLRALRRLIRVVLGAERSPVRP